MGVWGAGLYSSDMAADMRAVIKSALRLPFDEDRIVDILREGEGRAAADPNDEDHTTFWLVCGLNDLTAGGCHRILARNSS